MNKIITTSEFNENQKKYFELAETQGVIIKRGSQLVSLVATNKLSNSNKDWFNDFFAIPEQFRCNPFDYSPSGDLFYADKRNVEAVLNAIEHPGEGASIQINSKEELEKFLDAR